MGPDPAGHLQALVTCCELLQNGAIRGFVCRREPADGQPINEDVHAVVLEDREAFHAPERVSVLGDVLAATGEDLRDLGTVKVLVVDVVLDRRRAPPVDARPGQVRGRRDEVVKW